MKRVYLIVAALLLLAIIAGDIYFTHRNTTNDIALQGPGSLNGSPTSPADNVAQTNPVVDPTPIQQPAVATPVAYVRHTYRRHSSHPTRSIPAAGSEELYEPLTPETAEPVALNANPNAEIAVEKSKDYLGKMPAKTTVVTETKTERAHHNPPKGIGFEVGFNQNSLLNTSNSIPTGEVHIGLLADLNFGNHFALQPEVEYITKGNEVQNDNLSTREKLITHYIEVPVNAVFKMGQVGNVRFLAGGGPYVAYLVNSKDKFSGPAFSDVIGTQPTAQYNTGNLKKLDWGAGAFIGCQAPGGLFVKAGAEAGLTNMMKNNSPADHNFSLLLSAGYILGGR